MLREYNKMQFNLNLFLKVFVDDDLSIGSGREFHRAGPATYSRVFPIPNCKFALLTTKSHFEAEHNKEQHII